MAINLPIVSKFDPKGVKAAESALGKIGKIAGGAAAAAGAAVAGIAAVSIKAFADFDSKLNQSISIMGDVSDEMRDGMAQAARDVAKATTFSADEAAESFFFLASAGLDAEASIAAMPQVAKFAQAGMFDMALATDLLTDAQSALGMVIKNDANANLKEMTRLSDVLVRANTLANASVEQFSTALTTKAGASLRQFGKDAEEGVAVLAALADQGIKGELAGTNLSIAMRDLTSKALKNSYDFKQVGVAVFDASGEMRNMADIVLDLENATDGMSDAQKKATFTQLGFSDKSMGTLAALIGTSEAIRTYEGELRNASGFTEDVAAKQLETFTAQLDLMKSGVKDVAIGVGASLTPALGTLVGSFNDIVQSVGPKFTEFVEGLAPKLETAAEYFDRLVQLGTRVGGEFVFAKVFNDIKDAVTDFLGEGGLATALESLSDFRYQLFSAIIEGIPAIVEGLAEMLPNVIEFIAGTMIPTLLSQMTLLIDQLVVVFAEVMPTIIQAFTDMIPDLVQTLADLAPLLITTLLGMIPTLLNTAIDLFIALVDAVVEITPQLIETIVDLLPELVDSIISMLPGILDGAIELFTALVEALPIILPLLLTAIIDLLPKIIDSLISMLPALIDGAFQLFTGLIMGLHNMMPDLLVAVLGLIPQIVGTLLGAIPQLVQAGYEVVAGFARGIIENAPRILGNAIKSIGDTLVNGVKNFLGIQSPSKVFAGIGGDVVAGLEKGLGDGQKIVAGAAVDLSHNLTVSGSQAFANAVPSAASRASASGMVSAAPSTVINLSVNAGMGSNGQEVGEQIVDAIKRYERRSGRVFVSA